MTIVWGQPVERDGSAAGVQTYGVVVVTATNPRRSRIGPLSDDASTCR